jgi:hypothetical protein
MTAEVAQASTGDLSMTIGCRPHQRRATTALATALSLLAGGCASLVNTPAQDVAWSRWRICHTQAIGTEIRNVQLDGRIAFWYWGPGDRQVMLDCLRQAASTGLALPEPIADSLPRGA